MALFSVPKTGLALLACLLCVACGEEDRAGGSDDVIEAQDGKTDAAWLRAVDHVDPALWLASREVGRDLPANDLAVGRMREALLAARPHFLESDRMLANRTAQIGKMLMADGSLEDYAGLLKALANVAAAAGQKQTYGELCQHYYNLRHKGAARDDALRLLSARYETQKQFR